MRFRNSVDLRPSGSSPVSVNHHLVSNLTILLLRVFKCKT